MLGKVTKGALELVGAWTWLESFLKFVLFHFSSETYLSTIMFAASLVFSWAWEEISLANTKVRADAGTNDMSHILIVNRSNISLILARAWLVEVFISSASHFDAHMELGLCFCFLKLALNVIERWVRGKEARWLRLFSLGISNLH